MTDSQSSEKGVGRVLPELRVTKPHSWSVASFSPYDGRPSTTLASKKGSTSRMINMKLNKRKRPHKQAEKWLDNEISFPSTPGCRLVNSPIILEALIEGFLVRRIYVDEGSSSEVMYEHCFRNSRAETKAKLKESRTPLVGFSGEERSAWAEKKVKGRQTKKEILKAPHNRHLALLGKTLKQMKKIKGKDEHPEGPLENKPLEKVVIHDDYPNQTITIVGNLSTEYRSRHIEILRKHADAFA
nr:reverse transcriptase domain-containing protein [Tanacetum cinerariifolium]